MGKKVKAMITSRLNELLLEDCKYFDMERGTIGNKLFKYYSNKEIEIKDYIYEENTELNDVNFQFNLNKENDEMYFTIMREQNGIKDAEYIRKFLFNYLSKARYLREKILFKENFDMIREAKINNKKINMMYDNKLRTINPYYYKTGDVENTNYIFCYCETSRDYRAYKVSKMSNINISKKEIQVYDEDYVSKVYNNFDPFLSIGKYVKVRFTLDGEKKMKTLLNNRPKIISNKDREYIFECSDKLAKIYFAQFYNDVEILEPQELKNWMKDIYKKLLEMYK